MSRKVDEAQGQGDVTREVLSDLPRRISWRKERYSLPDKTGGRGEEEEKGGNGGRETIKFKTRDPNMNAWDIFSLRLKPYFSAAEFVKV